MLNDLLMSNPELYVEWKDPQLESNFDKDAMQLIVKHYGFAEILGNLLHGFSLAPLVDNKSLLSSLEIEDISVAEGFVEEAFSGEVKARNLFSILL
jgi:hypothetical protein